MSTAATAAQKSNGALVERKRLIVEGCGLGARCGAARGARNGIGLPLRLARARAPVEGTVLFFDRMNGRLGRLGILRACPRTRLQRASLHTNGDSYGRVRAVHIEDIYMRFDYGNGPGEID